MKRIISIFLTIFVLLSILTLIPSCTENQITYMEQPTINGVLLNDYTIVYDESALDYNKRAAEYIKNTAHSRYGITLSIVDDATEKSAHEIVVGETSREISSTLDAETKGLEFSIIAKDGSIALEGNYFLIAAAAFYFMENHALTNAQSSVVLETVSVHEPIVKEAKNYIMLIGDGMGVYHTKTFEYLENDRDFGDGENTFYGNMLPYQGFSKTDALWGITTDSAAGGTALACGKKTNRGYLGVDKDLKVLKSLTELATERGMSTAVMSTESQEGATPASFLVHIASRSHPSLGNHIREAQKKLGTIINCGEYDYNTRYNKLLESKIEDTLNKVSSNENGFFMMYEEAQIDKHSHDNELDKAFSAVIRFNQAIARFMEFAFYNPDTFILITADHETGELKPDENGNLTYNYDDHTSADVQIFAYGHKADLFNGVTIENIQIAHTIASFMGDDNFGDQSEFQSLTKGK